MAKPPISVGRQAPAAMGVDRTNVPPMPKIADMCPDLIRRFPELNKFDGALQQWRDRLMTVRMEPAASATVSTPAVTVVPASGKDGKDGKDGEPGRQGSPGQPGTTGMNVTLTAFVPRIARTGKTFTVPAYQQALFSEPIVMEPGTVFIIEDNAALIQV